jgi:hypothetical protein
MCIEVIKGAPSAEKFDRQAFYSILRSGDTAAVDHEIALLSGGTIIEREAYIGTLLMKKANLVSLPKHKLSLFKAGRVKLEKALQSDSSNVEYRFLRLIIEEHAPKVVKYHSQLADDAQYIRQYFGRLSPAVQHVVIDYSKTSRALKNEKFKTAEE